MGARQGTGGGKGAWLLSGVPCRLSTWRRATACPGCSGEAGDPDTGRVCRVCPACRVCRDDPAGRAGGRDAAAEGDDPGDICPCDRKNRTGRSRCREPRRRPAADRRESGSENVSWRTPSGLVAFPGWEAGRDAACSGDVFLRAAGSPPRRARGFAGARLPKRTAPDSSTGIRDRQEEGRSGAPGDRKRPPVADRGPFACRSAPLAGRARYFFTS